MIVKTAALEPAATVTEDGTVSATPASTEIVTGRPPAGADGETVTVQVVLPWGISVVAAQVRSLIAVDVMESDTALLEPPTVAVRLTLWLEATAAAVAENVAAVAPGATITEAGTINVAGALLAKATVVPFAGAAAASVTEQVVDVEGASTRLAHCNPVMEPGPDIVNV